MRYTPTRSPPPERRDPPDRVLRHGTLTRTYDPLRPEGLRNSPSNAAAVATIQFHVQDPTQAGRTLLDDIADAGDTAESGGGIFAFASARGVRLLLDDSVLGSLSRNGTFELVVGTDSITDERALAALEEGMRHTGVRARVLVHDHSLLFHPKVCWFASGERLTVLVGSGNLTLGGLATNLEAYTVAEYEPPDAAAVDAQIAAWLERWGPQLWLPDAPAALARARSNSGSERSLRRPMPPDEPRPHNADLDADVLVAEIPRNVEGRTQVDVGHEQFTGFFGGEAGRTKRILLQGVGPSGAVDELEPPRALFRTRSDNYRFEAGAGRGRSYPSSGRPIGVFLRSHDGIFRYRLLWPSDNGHAEVDAFLTTESGPFAGRMRRVAVKAA